MTEAQYRRQWLRWHNQYEKIAYRELIVGFRDLGNSIPFFAMTEDNYEMILDTNFGNEKFFNIYYNIYNEIGVIHGNRVGKEINKQIKEYNLNTFLSLFERNLLTWLFDNAAERVVTVRRTYLEYLRQLIAFGYSEGKTISEIATDIKRQVNQRGFYRWQALRIARTETTAAANHAAMVSTSSSGVLTQKVWVSAVDARTRRPPKSEFNHIAMNGVKVGKDEPFLVPFNGTTEKVMFPGDPKASPGNVINCRCSIALVPKRDSDGRILRE